MVAALRLRQGDVDGALAVADALKGRYPESGAPFAVEAELLAANKQYERASAAYDKALQLAGSDRAIAFRAFAVRQTGGLDSPEAPLLSYLLTAPSDQEMRLQAAQSFQNRGASQEAIQHYEQALGQSPDNSNILYDLGREYAKTGNSARAVSLIEQALETNAEFSRRADAEQLLNEIRQ